MHRTSPGAVDRILQLQSLRFFAAAFVLIGHALMEMEQQGLGRVPDFAARIPWGAGVDLFFVISGFIICHIQPRSSHGPAVALDFLIRRIIRLAPMYWLFTVLMIIATLALGQHVEHHRVSAEHVLKSLLFIPFVPEGSPVPRPILGQGWTLNYEMFFYLSFALTLLLARGRALLVCLVFLGLVAFGTLAGPIPTDSAFWFEPILIEFVIGVALAANRHRLPTLSRRTAIGLISFGLIWFVVVPVGDPLNGWHRLLERGLPSALIVFATLQVRNPPAAVTQGRLPLLGDASYALYLSHTFVTNIVVIAWDKLGLQAPALFVLIGFVASIAASVAVFLLIERPLLKLMTSQYQRSGLGRWLSGERPLRPAGAAGW
jgi:exopolysaccharide production protein ExoZ